MFERGRSCEHPERYTFRSPEGERDICMSCGLVRYQGKNGSGMKNLGYAGPPKTYEEARLVLLNV